VEGIGLDRVMVDCCALTKTNKLYHFYNKL